MPVMKLMPIGRRFALWKKAILNHRPQITLSLIFAIIAIILTFVSGFYVERVGMVSPPDLILDNLPVVDLSILYVWLFLFVIFLFVLYAFVYQPEKIHYMIGMLSLFSVIRSGFVVLTHLKMPEGAVSPLSYSPAIYDFFSFSNYLFFSGHVGLPFLGYLIYRENKKLRMIFLASSIILAATALLMHRHYSIDVLSAYFITYGIYKIGHYIFGHNTIKK